MPICPKCSATIHAGADDQCPACGYSLLRANEEHGHDNKEFRRVQDNAGILTHQDCQELIRFLEAEERRIPPVALCVYTTNKGDSKEFRSHAHWILNHAVLHHPSFGRRQRHRAIEESELRWREPGEAAPEPAATTGWFSRLCATAREYWQAARHKVPPPVRHEWMLILVLDAQLEYACFSWGYQLDPYIDPDSITRCITKAKLRFRERQLLPALRRVMKLAVREIAVNSHRVNARLRRSGAVAPALALALGASLLMATAAPAAAEVAPSPAPAAAAPAEPAFTDGAAAEEASPAEAATAATEAPVPTPPAADAPPPPPPGAPATYAAAPRWHEADHRHLMAGELTEGYNMLAPNPGQRPSPRFRNEGKSQESDKKLPARYVDAYKKPSAAGLCDPQGLLPVQERRDVECVLRELNANSRCHVYAALCRHGQQMPPELAVQSIANKAAPPCEYAVLLLFPLGDSQALDLGYKELKPTDEQRHAWLNRVRSAAAREGNGVESLLLALREVQATLNPVVAALPPISVETAGTPERIQIEYKPEDEDKEPSIKEKIAAYFADAEHQTQLISLGAIFALITPIALYLFFRRRSSQLLPSVADVRLSSPYGAGVSRYVRYLEGVESPKEKDRLLY